MLARFSPGCTTIRPFLHRLRGVSIGKNVFIGDEVYLENEHPSAVEIQDGVHISLRAVILAHTRGAGRVVIEKDAFIGPNVVIATWGGRTLYIGAGAVIGAGVVIGKDVPAKAFVPSTTVNPVATAMVPLTTAETMEAFLLGLVPVERPAVKSSVAGAAASNSAAVAKERNI